MISNSTPKKQLDLNDIQPTNLLCLIIQDENRDKYQSGNVGLTYSVVPQLINLLIQGTSIKTHLLVI